MQPRCLVTVPAVNVDPGGHRRRNYPGEGNSLWKNNTSFESRKVDLLSKNIYYKKTTKVCNLVPYWNICLTGRKKTTKEVLPVLQLTHFIVFVKHKLFGNEYMSGERWAKNWVTSSFLLITPLKLMVLGCCLFFFASLKKSNSLSSNSWTACRPVKYKQTLRLLRLLISDEWDLALSDGPKFAQCYVRIWINFQLL